MIIYKKTKGRDGRGIELIEWGNRIIVYSCNRATAKALSFPRGHYVVVKAFRPPVGTPGDRSG